MNAFFRLAALVACGLAAATSAKAQSDIWPWETIDTEAGCCFIGSTILDGDTLVTMHGVKAVVHTRAHPVWAVQQTLSNPDYSGRYAHEYYSREFREPALSGDSLLVGGASPRSGFKDTVYVFARSGGTWKHVQRLALGPTPGYRVVLTDIVSSGSWAAVRGVRVNDTTNQQFTQIDFYRRNANGTYSRRAALRVPYTSYGQMALGHDTLVLADPQSDERLGSVYVYAFDTVRGWHLQARLRDPDPRPMAGFGDFVGVDGDHIAVAAPYYGQDEGARHIGAVYVFERSDRRWVQSEKIENDGSLDPNGPDGSLLGEGLAVSGDTIVAGMVSRTYIASVFEKIGSSWVPTARLVYPEGTDNFDGGVRISGRTVILDTYTFYWYDPRGYVFRLPFRG